MSDLTTGQRIALDTFLSSYDENVCFDLLLRDITAGSWTCATWVSDFADIDEKQLVEYIKSLAETIDRVQKCAKNS